MAQLWPSFLGGVVAIRTVVPSLHLACYTYMFVSILNISSFPIVRMPPSLGSRGQFGFLLPKIVNYSQTCYTFQLAFPMHFNQNNEKSSEEELVRGILLLWSNSPSLKEVD